MAVSEERKRALTESLSGRRILIWGYGREGKSTENFIRKYCDPASLEIYEGKIDGIREENYDLIIKSPGIVMEEENGKITSQTDLVLGAFRERIIGITGTKGKSTTSTMLFRALTACGMKAVLVGNIGKPALDEYENIDPDTWIVYEMSCHQLAHAKVSPHIAVFLNLYEEHLDYYGTMEKYCAAKSNIARWQHKGDTFYRGYNVPDITTAADVIRLSAQPERKFALRVNGTHNIYNADVVCRIAEQLGGDPDRAKAAVEEFGGLPHRLENIGTKNGITYYDDSISTIPEAAIGAASSLPNVKTILIGGMDRGIDYSRLKQFILERPDLIFILGYATGERIGRELTGETGTLPANCVCAADLREQVEKAGRCTPEGCACVLSPAAASYGYFRNFEERGDVFRSLVFGEEKADL